MSTAIWRGQRLSVLFVGVWLAEHCGQMHALRSMSMACPFRASSLQGHTCVSRSGLANNDPGTGPGWQQSRQNWTLLAVVGPQPRVEHSDPYNWETLQRQLCLHANGFSWTPRTWFQLRAPVLWHAPVCSSGGTFARCTCVRRKCSLINAEGCAVHVE